MVSYDLTDEQRQIRQLVRSIAEKHFRPNAGAADRERRPPLENVKLLAEQGLVGHFLSPDLGGPGLGLLSSTIIMEEIARCCGNTAICTGSTDGSGPRTLLMFADEERRRRWAEQLMAGELFVSFGMSEPEAGSDISNIRTTAVLDGGDYVLNGTKLWCTGAQFADLFVIVARIGDAPGLKGLALVLVPRDAPGFTVGKHIELMGLRASGMAELSFEDCRVPAENLLLPPGRLREIFGALNSDRVAANPALCLGVAQGAFELAVEHAATRTQFGRALSDNQGIQWRLADMAVRLETARALLYQAAARTEAGTARPIDASIAKLYVNEATRQVADDAIQIFGAMGLSEEMPLERAYRDIRGMSVGYGTTEILRNGIFAEIKAGRHGW